MPAFVQKSHVSGRKSADMTAVLRAACRISFHISVFVKRVRQLNYYHYNHSGCLENKAFGNIFRPFLTA